MARVTVAAISKAYGAARAISDVSFEVGDGEFVSLLGPSGCGKTTTLRAIAGFVHLDHGRILIGDCDVTDRPPYERDTSLVFQSYALFPHMTVRDNVAFGLRMRRSAPSELRSRVEEVLRLVGLESLAARLPGQLSGGQQQRVALARALVVRPSVLLLDEPLSNLDAKLREQMRVEIRELQQRLKLTAIFVTHDQEEALSLSDRLVVMRDGLVEQIGTPTEVYERPRTRFVADFIGSANIIEGHWDGGGVLRTAGGLIVRTHTGAGTLGAAGVIAIRPQAISIQTSDDIHEDGCAKGRVEFVSYRGSELEYRVRLTSSEVMRVRHQVAGGGVPYPPGTAVKLSWDPIHSIIVD